MLLPPRTSFHTLLLIAIGCQVVFPDCARGHRVSSALHALEDSTFNESLQEFHGEDSGAALPIPILAAATAINWLWTGSTTILSVRNIYVALQVYKERSSVSQDLADAFVRSRIIALEEAHQHQGDGAALADIFSVDSLSALRTFVDTSTRIGQMCTEDNMTSGAVIKQHADHAKDVYNAMKGKVCEGLAQEVQAQSQRASAVAQEYWKSLPGLDLDEELWYYRTLYYETAKMHHKVYTRDFFDEYDNGLPSDDEIDLGDFERDCQPKALEQCTAPQSVDTSEARTTSVGITQEFDQIMENVTWLLQGIEDADCPSYVFNDCARRAMLCTYKTRAMFKALEAYWKELEEIAAATEAKTMVSKSIGSRIHGYLERFTLSRIHKKIENAISWASKAELLGTIFKFMYKFRRSISNLLRGVGLETWAVKQVWKVLWKHGVMNDGNFIQRFIRDKALRGVGTKLYNELPKLAIPSVPAMAGWLHSFSWLAINRAKTVNISDACNKAAHVLQTGEDVDMAEIERMVDETV